ncbi:MAG TPA: SRPBCC family protein, partial [Mycobacterium sp.]|nr:SRPBCC family protein [Mycobacterium sp.]
MASPLLQAQIDINAPVAKVWALVSDLRRMPQWSPQCRLMKSFGPLRQGTRTVNLNRRKFLFWPTTSRIIEVIPEKKLAFRVNENGTIWSYELEPTDTGTRLTETRHAENGVK